ncbi:hypothetical protein BJ508DRAFT_378991 [Ascobolus immersus RN42]|uniref:Uncharacterized protein n=1 Tax=Ascobolus immersus RN42 TaxID=1160509 RepID=A0A3N4HTR3_ASCIM|nr:hypothetical protein BJ508DRAFT_378991 [Ascobolus immersus RN42]
MQGGKYAFVVPQHDLSSLSETEACASPFCIAIIVSNNPISSNITQHPSPGAANFKMGQASRRTHTRISRVSDGESSEHTTTFPTQQKRSSSKEMRKKLEERSAYQRMKQKLSRSGESGTVANRKKQPGSGMVASTNVKSKMAVEGNRSSEKHQTEGSRSPADSNSMPDARGSARMSKKPVEIMPKEQLHRPKDRANPGLDIPSPEEIQSQQNYQAYIAKLWGYEILY